MTPIRPNSLPPTPGPSQGQDATRSAAQKAFFDAAMGRAQAPAAAAPTAFQTVATRAPAPVQAPPRIPNPTAEPPAKILRPGSLLDIRV